MAVASSITFLCNGVSLADALQSIGVQADQEELDATVLANTYRSYEAGFKSGTVTTSGLFDHDGTNADEIHNVFSTAYNAGSTNQVTYSLGTLAVGGDAVMLNGCEMSYDIQIPLGQLIAVAAQFKAINGIGFGKWLASVQLNAGTTNGTAVDNAAGTTNGGIFQVHLHNDTATDCDFKVQHSTDNSVWNDLTGAAVNNLSAAHTSGYAEVALGTTVNRYIRLVSVITGGNTVLVSAAFTRR
jgi:hypothetical protein